MSKTVRSFASALTGAVTAASVMYYFDAASGRGRRAQLTERSGSVARRVMRRLQAAGGDLIHRAGGIAARGMASLRSNKVDAQVLVERVRACLGRVVSHPGAIHVGLEEPQRVVLRGALLAWEHQPLLRAVSAVIGVREVKDELAVYESAEHISALQGGIPRRVLRPALLQERWSPGTRLLMAAAGSGLLFGGSRRRGAWGAVGAAAGSALLLRSLVNAPLRDIARGRRQFVEVRKTLRVRAPVERVFETLRQYENFPHFMRNVTHVQRRANGSTHWIMAGPWGTRVEWDAITTQIEPNRLLAWRTVEGSPIQHWGMLRFERAELAVDKEAEVLLHVYLCYSQPAGRLGLAVARAFGADPYGELDQDLQRLKRFLESDRSQTEPPGAASPADLGAAAGAARH